MTVLNDSEAFYDKERLLPQHQTALALIQNVVENPQLDTYSWLDLCCGRGQIITHLESMIDERSRSKISYSAYDVKSDFASLTQRKAETLGLSNVRVEVGDIANFTAIYTNDFRADFITLTNTVHEINVHILSKLYIETILRLNEPGCLFIYDMEHLPKLELGAITWSAAEMQRIIITLINSLGVTDYAPKVSRVPHKSTFCWSIQLRREYFRKSREEILEKSEEASKNTQELINGLILEKYESCKGVLDSLTKYGSDNKQEESELQSLLYDFWALSRALGVITC